MTSTFISKYQKIVAFQNIERAFNVFARWPDAILMFTVKLLTYIYRSGFDNETFLMGVE